ncbi:hypothetical protein CEXT_102111 [Caerostris extrusa]|uniref:Uncharacterized protein n=1 Tax=Caerostris extrusa TaxID=172846 RepID=A0AAV4MYX1_CAEEX|nr:hypothetical protein CEXT_102111 [Caerostris extrusa]
MLSDAVFEIEVSSNEMFSMAVAELPARTSKEHSEIIKLRMTLTGFCNVNSLISGIHPVDGHSFNSLISDLLDFAMSWHPVDGHSFNSWHPVDGHSFHRLTGFCNAMASCRWTLL